MRDCRETLGETQADTVHGLSHINQAGYFAAEGEPVLAFPNHLFFLTCNEPSQKGLWRNFSGAYNFLGPLLSPFCRWGDVNLLLVFWDVSRDPQLFKDYGEQPHNDPSQLSNTLESILQGPIDLQEISSQRTQQFFLH